ncbi:MULTISPECIES: hypothetical protein [unclassified Streptomyces]|uniref:hypothetical protein n=1 Tax=unclassified Streptomyces TaxID=2593676 RepID=UPI001BE99FCA|nr:MULTISPECIES: hypothetical protein [unclassified Streptomyces]MBT2408110.1 hypothetical protein [Streptomyces sp. ISL-21]MBT2455614.1 hypothetical protein [Streptomyces sp. ISL-86]MBT2609560.1 hypothetical protein [Streptomyces sp. ISL-87]
MKKPSVVVQAPDIRGLREVTIDGSPAGSAWSLRDLRKQLRRAHLPEDMDLEDRTSVSWRGADSSTWPDRTGRRRAVIALMTAGLLASMTLLVDIGRPDAFGALTFSGRITGILFILSGAAEGIAAAVAFDYWGKRTLRYAGAIVLVGVLIAVATQSLLLFMWFQEREYTPYLLIIFPVSLWSVWALRMLWREQAWKGIPHPKSFTTGLVATALLASTNFAYSAIYQPSSTPLLIEIKAEFGTPQTDPKDPIIHLPVKFHLKNTGRITAYVITSYYYVKGRSAPFDGTKTSIGEPEWRRDMEDEVDMELHVGRPKYRRLNDGKILDSGDYFEPGDSADYDKIIQIPRDAPYDSIEIESGIIFLRGDRGRIDAKFGEPIYSWLEKKDRFFDCTPESPCLDYVVHYGRMHHNNNIINVTRRPRYVSAWRFIDQGKSDVGSMIAPFNSKGRLSDQEDDSEKYGMVLISPGYVAIPFAALLNLSRSKGP